MPRSGINQFRERAARLRREKERTDVKKDVTYVDVEKMLGVVRELGLSWKEQAGYAKVECAPGRFVYVARSKRCGRVDLSGFEVPAALGVKNLGGEAFGGVKQRLDMSAGRTEEQIVASFRAVVEHARGLPAREAPRRQPMGVARRIEPSSVETGPDVDRLRELKKRADEQFYRTRAERMADVPRPTGIGGGS